MLQMPASGAHITKLHGEITCVHCGEPHASDGCFNAPKCINCSKSDLGYECSHRADSSDCASYKNFRKGEAPGAKK